MRYLSFYETMSGSYSLYSGSGDPARPPLPPRVERPLSFTIQTRSRGLWSFLRQPELAVEGEISAEGFADHKYTRGTLVLDILRAGLLPYFLRFRTNDGQECSFEGRKVLVRGAFVESMTVLPGSLRNAAGAEIGRALVRFDLRSDLFKFLRSFEIRRFG